MDSRREIKFGIIISYINLLISSVIPIVYTPIMLKFLGQDEYGLYSLANSVVGYLGLLNFGIGGSMIRFISKYRAAEDEKNVKRTVGLYLKLYFIFSIIVVIVGFIISSNVNLYFGKSLSFEQLEKMSILVKVMSISTAISFVSNVFSAVIISYERFIFRKLLDLVIGTLPLFVRIVVLYLGGLSVSLTIVGMVFEIVMLLSNMWYCQVKLQILPDFSHVSKVEIKEVFMFSIFVFLSEIVNILYWATDKILLGALLGTASVAVYNLAGTFNSIMQSMTTSIAGFFTPKIVKLSEIEHNEIAVNEIFIRIGRIQAYIVFLILSGFIVFGKSFIILWVGKLYEDSFYIALLTMIPIAIPIIQSIGYQILLARNLHKFRSIVYAIIAIINVVATYFVIPEGGAIGAAFVSSLAYVIGPGVILNLYYKFRVKLSVGKFWTEIFKILLPNIILCTVSKIVVRTVVFDNYIQLFLGIIIYTFAYCGINFFSMNEYERGIIINVVNDKLSSVKKIKNKH